MKTPQLPSVPFFKFGVIFSLAMALLNPTGSAWASHSKFGFEPFEFRVGGIIANNSTGNTESGFGSWDPRFSLWIFNIGGNLGVSYFKGLGGGLLVYDYGGLFGIKLGRLEIEGSLGIQDWVNQGNYTAAGGELILHFGRSWLKIFNHIFAGYTYLLNTNGTQELKLGLGISL